MISDVLALVAAKSPPLLDRRRAQAIVDRVRGFALLFAALTLAWIAVDAFVFASPVRERLAIARLAAGAAFLALALSCRAGAPRLRPALLRLALLFAVPAVFFAVALELLRPVPHEGLAAGVAAMYTLVPFALAAGVAVFPLTPRESAALASLAFLVAIWAFVLGAGTSQTFGILESLWLLFLVAAVATFAAASQLRLMADLVQQATRDPLTGCHRRESGRELLEMQLSLATRREAPLALLFADLDRFKLINDTCGHEVGDQVLAHAAGALRESLRESDLVLRWGGEEFVVVLPDTTSAEAVALVERLRERGIGRLPDGRAVTLSIGIAEYRADGIIGAAALVDLADRRMYLAKQAGRNRCVHSDSGEARVILAAV